jgi:hypothetical protein
MKLKGEESWKLDARTTKKSKVEDYGCGCVLARKREPRGMRV